MEGPILLFVFVLVCVIGWACAERYGGLLVRVFAGLAAFFAFAILGAAVMALIAFGESISTRHRLNMVVCDMLDRTIERLEADDRDALLADLKEMRTEVVPTYEYWTFEEPFVEFARQKDSPSPEAEVAP